MQSVLKETWKAILSKNERGFANERLYQWGDLDPELADEAAELLHASNSGISMDHIHCLLEM
jgi:hypothetical protein